MRKTKNFLNNIFKSIFFKSISKQRKNPRCKSSQSERKSRERRFGENLNQEVVIMEAVEENGVSARLFYSHCPPNNINYTHFKFTTTTCQMCCIDPLPPPRLPTRPRPQAVGLQQLLTCQGLFLLWK